MPNDGRKILIRTAETGDAPLLAALGVVTFYEAYFEQDEPADMANYLAETFGEGTIAAELGDSNVTYFICLRDGKAVGYAKLLRNSRADGISENSVELKRIYLVERVWGSGVGDILLKHCIEAARQEGYDAIWLGVWEENARARRFYARHGFEEVGTVEFPYGEVVGINRVVEKKL